MNTQGKAIWQRYEPQVNSTGAATIDLRGWLFVTIKSVTAQLDNNVGVQGTALTILLQAKDGKNQMVAQSGQVGATDVATISMAVNCPVSGSSSLGVLTAPLPDIAVEMDALLQIMTAGDPSAVLSDIIVVLEGRRVGDD